jgi:hypothetical protein
MAIVGSGGSIPAQQRFGHGRQRNRSCEPAVANLFELAVPTGNRQQYFKPNFGIVGRFRDANYATPRGM